MAIDGIISFPHNTLVVLQYRAALANLHDASAQVIPAARKGRGSRDAQEAAAAHEMATV
jgi:hypothetical protein